VPNVFIFISSAIHIRGDPFSLDEDEEKAQHQSFLWLDQYLAFGWVKKPTRNMLRRRYIFGKVRLFAVLSQLKTDIRQNEALLAH
jgi:hypothetical protein